MARNVLSRRWFMAVPLILIVGGVAVFLGLSRSTDTKILREGVTYDVWLAEAEATPKRADGSGWDLDGSAPDLFGMLVWQDQRILETVTAADQLISQWDSVALNLYKVVANGEADTASVRRVGHVRPTPDGYVEAAVLDADTANSDFVGGFRIPFHALRVGTNKVTGRGQLKNLTIVVVETGKDPAEASIHELKQNEEGVTELIEPTRPMKGAASNLADDVTNAAKDAMKPLNKDLKDLKKKADETTRKAGDWIQKQLGE
jgi:hypothetical protein